MRADAAIWILSPVEQNERVFRALRWNAQVFKDSDRAYTEAGIPRPTLLPTRLSKLQAVADRHDLDFNGIRKGYTSTAAITAADEHTRSSLRLLFAWRLTSGFAHGWRWAPLGFRDQMVTTPTADPDITNLRVDNHLSRALCTASAAGEAVTAAVTLHNRLGTAP